MKKMINLCLKTEYSFKQTFAPMSKILNHDNGHDYIGVADINNTFSHIYLENICKENNKKPIFGVRLMVTDGAEKRIRGNYGPEYIFIAKNKQGLKEINQLVQTSYDKFYYKAMISTRDMLNVSKNVFVISESPETLERLDFIGLSPSTPKMMKGIDHPKVAIQNNRYFTALDKSTYQLIAGARRSGTGLNFLYNSQTYPQHVLTTEEWFRIWKDEEAIENTHVIAEQCFAEIPTASMVKYSGKVDIFDLAMKGAKEKGIDIVNEGKYKTRFEWEINLIQQKEYTDYFLIVAEMIQHAKKTMLVGPARGSAAGSLVCYLIGITEVDPIKFGLLFERFIDINRADLPDIDVDFPDTKRQQVIKNLIKKFKQSNVCHISNINRLKAKSAIGEISMSLSIPKWEVDLVKESIVDRSGGDARAKMAAYDTLTGTEVGKEFLKKYPAAECISEVEGHASHAGKHAAGIIVCNDEIINFGGVNSREGAIMMDKKGAELKNLLKIDALGLRTLSILEECADQIGMEYSDYYKLPLDDEKTYDIFNDMRLSAIFQFEGRAMQMLCQQMGCDTFDDVVALTALARPGPLHSGGAAKFVKRRIGEAEIEYASNHPSYVECTKKTYGIIIYQEQLMEICRICGNMNFEEVAAIRRGSSKTLGKEFFQKYFESFKKGARQNKFKDEEIEEIWNNMVMFGSWGMNKCLTGNTKVRIAHGNQKIGRDCEIEVLYDMYVKNPTRWVKQTGKMPVLLSYINGRIRKQEAKRIIKNRIKNCFRFTLSNGEHFECTEDHKFIINGEWKEIKNAKVGDELLSGSKKNYKRKSTGNSPKGIQYEGRGFPKGVDNPAYVNGKTKFLKEFSKKMSGLPCEDCGKHKKRMEKHHNDFNRGLDDPADLSWLCSGCHKIRHYDFEEKYPYSRGFDTYTLEIKSIENIGMQQTYDIEMPEVHNFVLSSGPITHNSHTVSYGMISYWCAYMKAHHPLEFAAANLNNSKSEDSAIQILRDCLENEGIEYEPVDPDNSGIRWAAHDGKLIGGLTNIHGIGEAKAKEIIQKREGGRKFTPAIIKKLIDPKTPYDILYPTDHYFGNYYTDYRSYGMPYAPKTISEIEEAGEYLFLGRINSKDLRDLNEYNELMKRGGKVWDTNNKDLRLVVQDDTNQILCKITRFDFDKMNAQKIYEELVEEKSYVIIRGHVKEGWRIVYIKAIFEIGKVDKIEGLIEER